MLQVNRSIEEVCDFMSRGSNCVLEYSSTGKLGSGGLVLRARVPSKGCNGASSIEHMGRI